MTSGFKASGYTQLIFSGVVLQLLGTEIKKELAADICMQSPRSQTLNKPVGASLFCPFSRKLMGRVTREAGCFQSPQDSTAEPGRLQRDGLSL